MNLKILRLTLQSATPMHDDATKLCGFFAASFNEYALLHQHTADELIYKYPLVIRLNKEKDAAFRQKIISSAIVQE